MVTFLVIIFSVDKRRSYLESNNVSGLLLTLAFLLFDLYVLQKFHHGTHARVQLGLDLVHKQAMIGSSSNYIYNGDSNKNVIQKTNFTFLNYVTIIPTSSTCIMWPNYPGAESVRTVVKFR